MEIITEHDITLYGGTDRYRIVLRPLNDGYLPLLYRWNADPEVLYWTEGGEDIVRSYDQNTVNKIYGGVSQSAFCFLVEVNGVPIGDCWLQKMNLPDVLAMYHGKDVRRIDMEIGEKEYWGKGIGTTFTGMMADFAFTGERADVLHCLCEDYNIRSSRIWRKNGFSLIRSDELPQPQKGKKQFHYALTRREYIRSRRHIPPANGIFDLPIAKLRPSQLYISEGKLALAREWFDSEDRKRMDAIPVKLLDGNCVMTDGHTRAVLAYLAGWKTVPAYWETENLNWQAYRQDIAWCGREGVIGIQELSGRIVSHRDYENLWRKRCMEAAFPSAAETG